MASIRITASVHGDRARRDCDTRQPRHARRIRRSPQGTPRTSPAYPRTVPDAPLWQRRFRVPVIGFPTWSRSAPDRIAYVSSESGIYQLHSWDLETGERRQVSTDPVGVISGEISADGEWVVWHRDLTGDESGTFVAAPFAGGSAEPLVEGLPVAWDQGVVLGHERTLAAMSDRDGFALYVSDHGGPARLLHRSPEAIVLGGGSALVRGGTAVGALSADEDLVVIEHSEHGDLLHPALRVIDPGTGSTVADLRDEGLALTALAWSPKAGDRRLAIGHERRGEQQPAIWDLATGEVRELRLPWDRLTEVADWWPDASAVLLVELRDGRHVLHRYDLATDRIATIETLPGSMTGARVRPNGAVWYRL